MSLERLTKFSLDYPKTVIGLMLLITLFFALQLPSITIDTDPENMMEADQADRLTYDRVKQDFGVHDLIVVGIVDEVGIFRPESLEQISFAIDAVMPPYNCATLIGLRHDDELAPNLGPRALGNSRFVGRVAGR